jgi:hypothetical protein
VRSYLSRVGLALRANLAASLRLLGSGFSAFTRWCLTPFGQALRVQRLSSCGLRASRSAPAFTNESFPAPGPPLPSVSKVGTAPHAVLLPRVGLALRANLAASLRLLGSGSVAFTRWCLTPFGQALPLSLNSFAGYARGVGRASLPVPWSPFQETPRSVRSPDPTRGRRDKATPCLLYVCRCRRILPLHFCTGLRPICTFARPSQLTVLVPLSPCQPVPSWASPTRTFALRLHRPLANLQFAPPRFIQINQRASQFVPGTPSSHPWRAGR